MAQSFRSIKSHRSLKQVNTSVEFELIENNSNAGEKVDFSVVVVAAITKVECPVNVVVDNVFEVVQQIKQTKSKMLQKHVPMVKTVSADSKVSDSSNIRPVTSSTLVITASHDNNNRLVELSINKYRHCVIPRVLIQILSYILPIYAKLTKFKINNCSIDKHTIYDLKDALIRTRITDVSLDSTFLPEGNYYILLEEATALKHLSLRRCNINDEVCIRIFSELDLSKPSEKVLLTLDLSTNRITDVGAKRIGEILRTNRHLRYLNLADNQITDDGASHIFEVLKEFPLTREEIIDKRAKYITYLRNKCAVYNKCLQDIELMAFKKSHLDSVNKTTSKKKKIPSSNRSGQLPLDGKSNKVELMTLELVGPFQHPFRNTQIILKDGYPYSKGNMILSYLNLAYNNLMYPSLKKLLTVLQYQQVYTNNELCGLMKIVLAGNNLPKQCIELETINEILTDRVLRSFSQCRKSVNFGRKPAKHMSEHEQ